MNAISTFTFSQNSQIRIIIINDNPWFVAKDICDALSLSNHRDAISKLDKDEKGVALTDTLGGQQELNIINESGMYALVMRSRDAMKEGTPQHKFRKWVTSEVLPSIRKTGKYEAQQINTPKNYIDSNDMMNIKRLIWCCAGHLDQKQSANNAIWHSLRHATGVPSPAKFEVKHLPLMAQQLQHILSVIIPYVETRQACEQEIIKRLLRGQEDAQPLMAQLVGEMQESALKASRSISHRFSLIFDRGCSNLIQRKPCNIDYPEFNLKN